jgi:ribonuclease P protein component
VEGRYVQLVVAPTAVGGGRVGYVIGRKVAPRAVDRNRLRRKLREVARALYAQWARFDVIVRVRRAADRGEQDAAAREAQRLLGGLVGFAVESRERAP